MVILFERFSLMMLYIDKSCTYFDKWKAKATFLFSLVFVLVNVTSSQLSPSTLVFNIMIPPCTCILALVYVGSNSIYYSFLSHIVRVYCRFIYDINTTVSTPTADRRMSPVTQCRSASRRIRPLADVQITSSPFHPQTPIIMTAWGSGLEKSCGMDFLPHHSISMRLICNHVSHADLFPKEVIMYSLYSTYILRGKKTIWSLSHHPAMICNNLHLENFDTNFFHASLILGNAMLEDACMRYCSKDWI